MESSSYRVMGKAVDRLPQALADALEVSAVVQHGDVTVLCHEKFYMRIESNLMSTIVLSRMERDRCYVDIVTGGGKHAFMGMSLGAEKKHTSVISETLESVCSNLGLRVAPS